MSILDLLEKVTAQLETLHVEYMISGSVAANVYAVARQTRDIDLVVNLKEEDADNFISMFSDRFYLNEKTIKEEIKRKGFFNLINPDSGYKIDIVVLKTSEYRQHEFKRRIFTKINGFKAWVVSVEDLILSKLIWIQELESERQKTDIQTLLETADIDKNYLKLWIEKLNLKTYHLL